MVLQMRKYPNDENFAYDLGFVNSLNQTDGE